MSLLTLADLRPLERARILEVGAQGQINSAEAEDLVRALLEMGVVEGSEVQILHVAPWSQDPIAVQVRGALIALRRQEAAWVRVERVQS
jgi:ferrous iron transport protein A